MKKESIYIFLQFLLFFGGCAGCLQYMSYERNNIRESARLQVQEFGGQGKVVELYSYRTGNKSANFSYNTDAVLENDRGDRIIAAVFWWGSKNKIPALVGDVWKIGVGDQSGRIVIYLDKLLVRAGKINK